MPTTTHHPDQLLTPSETKAMLGLKSEGTLQVWRSTRRYPLPWVKVGRHVRYRLSDVEKFIESRTERPVDLSE